MIGEENSKGSQQTFFGVVAGEHPNNSQPQNTQTQEEEKNSQSLETLIRAYKGRIQDGPNLTDHVMAYPMPDLEDERMQRCKQIIQEAQFKIGEIDNHQATIEGTNARETRKHLHQEDNSQITFQINLDKHCTILYHTTMEEIVKQNPHLQHNMKNWETKSKNLDPQQQELEELLYIPIDKIGGYCEGEEGNSTLRIQFGENHAKAILDSGSGVVIMTKQTWAKWGQNELIPTKMRLQLADGHMEKPLGIWEKVIVEICGILTTMDLANDEYVGVKFQNEEGYDIFHIGIRMIKVSKTEEDQEERIILKTGKTKFLEENEATDVIKDKISGTYRKSKHKELEKEQEVEKNKKITKEDQQFDVPSTSRPMK
ncbi:hypothetical protein KP509_16G022700 [Ceratopteris richardii]|uniref:Uncharacterized protein n=1 Tax=Ceratopteris richardii TaxID=49495 RepID=A0A8T2SX93_CERRI|nr:hypothetical protein KP509_16G022700 [Ceratopteris richardii]